MHILMYFIYTSVAILLIYNFITTVFFSLKHKLLATQQNIHTVQKMTLVMIFFAMMLYLCKASNVPTKFYVIPWIWGFLTSHIFISRKKSWINELLGLGILLAITIVLFFKQEEIIQTILQEQTIIVTIEITLVYMILGLFLGVIFWAKTKPEKK